MKQCIVVASSAFNAEAFLRRMNEFASCFIVAVDGGYAHLADLGMVPDLAVGDFDSLGYVPTDCKAIVHDPMKDQSDMEIALDWAISEGFDSFSIFGALGERLDHTVANIQLFARYVEAGASIEVIGENESLTYLVGPASLELPAKEQGTISVFSLVPESLNVNEKGLLYQLDHATLSDRTSLGLSNEFIGESVTISVEQGTLLIMQIGEQ